MRSIRDLSGRLLPFSIYQVVMRRYLVAGAAIAVSAARDVMPTWES